MMIQTFLSGGKAAPCSHRTNKCTEYLKQHITQCLSNEFINPFYNPVELLLGLGMARLEL